MRNDKFVLISVFVIIAAIFFNFEAVIMGKELSILNFIVSVFYIVFWYWFMLKVKGSKYPLLYSTCLSGITFVSAVLVLVINVTSYNIPSAVILIILFLSPMYGLGLIFSNGFVALSAVMAGASIVWFIFSAGLYKKSVM